MLTRFALLLKSLYNCRSRRFMPCMPTTQPQWSTRLIISKPPFWSSFEAMCYRLWSGQVGSLYLVLLSLEIKWLFAGKIRVITNLSLQYLMCYGTPSLILLLYSNSILLMLYNETCLFSTFTTIYSYGSWS
jgi:hypothetical protein